jgi:hypothetical protein
MTDIDYTQLQHTYGGLYIARRDGTVLTSAKTYDTLSEQLEDMALEGVDLIIEYVEPANSVSVY